MTKFCFLRLRWKYLMLLFVGLTFALNAASAECKWVFELWAIEDDAPIAALAFSEFEPTVTFSDNQLIVTTKYFDVEFYDLNMIRKITYKIDEGSGINDIIADKPLMKFVGNDIEFTGVKAGDKISVFAINGIQIMDKKVAASGDFTLSLSNLSQGVYLININGRTFKIVKK